MSVKETLFVACERKRRAFALGEALILIIVVLLAFGGIFSSMAYAMRLRSSSQVDLDSYTTAQAWFDALEATPAHEKMNQKVLNQSGLKVTESLGGSKISEGRFRLRSLELEAFFKEARDGAYLVELLVRKPHGDGGGELRFLRSFNSYNSNTVRDSPYKRRDGK